MPEVMEANTLLDASVLYVSGAVGHKIESFGAQISGKWYLITPTLFTDDGEPEEVLGLVARPAPVERPGRLLPPFDGNSLSLWHVDPMKTTVFQSLKKTKLGTIVAEFRGARFLPSNGNSQIELRYALDEYELPMLELVIS